MIRNRILLFLTLLVSGCTVGPDYKPPIVSVPKQWTDDPTINRAAIPQAQQDQWWKSFKDPVLDRLINDAIAANLDLKQALVRVKEARAQRWITITAGLPTITGKSTADDNFPIRLYCYCGYTIFKSTSNNERSVFCTKRI